MIFYRSHFYLSFAWSTYASEYTFDRAKGLKSIVGLRGISLYPSPTYNTLFFLFTYNGMIYM